MTRKYCFVLALFVLTINMKSISQEFRVDTVSLSIDGQQVMALRSSIEPDIDFVKKETQRYYSNHFKVSLKGKDKLEAKEVLIQEISTKRMNLFIILEKDKFGTTAYTFAQFGFDIYLDTTDFKNEFESMSYIFTDCVRDVLNSYYKLQAERLRKEIRKKNREQKKLLREIKHLDRYIAKNVESDRKLVIRIESQDENATFKEKKLELQVKLKELQIEREYNSKRLEVVKKNINGLSSDLEHVNEKIERLNKE